MPDRNPLYDFGDEGEGEAPTFNERWGNLPVEAPRFNLTPNVALVESEPKPLKQNIDPVTGRPDLKFVPVDDPWANTPKPIKRLLGVGGEERYQLWPERALRSGLSAPLDAMQGKLPTIDPETGDVARTAMEPNLLGRMLGMKGGWQGVSPEGAIGRSQDVASVGGPGGLMNLREEGVLGSHGGNLVQPTPKVAPFYSTVEHAVSNIKQDKMPADQWLGTLTNSKGVKPEELDWTGLKDHLSSKGKEPVTKQEVQDYVNANKVELKEVNKGNVGVVVRPNEEEPHILQVYHPNDPNGERDGIWGEIINKGNKYEVNVPELPRKQFNSQQEAEDFINKNSNIGSSTKYSQYQLPGAESGSYKEMLMTLPSKDLGMQEFGPEKQAEWQQLGQMGRRNRTEAQNQRWMQLDDELYNIQQSKGDATEYKSSHWDEPNVLAHVRTNDRNITAPGETVPKKSLHIEEIQSDWHQAGRDKGYNDKLPNDPRPALKKANDEFNKLDSRHPYNGDISYKAYVESLLENEQILHNKLQEDIKRLTPEVENYEKILRGANNRVPDAPFKKTWHELALKRMIREAAEKGYDRLSWTPGEAQAARYDLSKQVDAIKAVRRDDGLFDLPMKPKNSQHYQGGASHYGVPAEKLPDYVGKDLANKILSDVNTHDAARKNENFSKEYIGLDLKVGGEGMKGFYDKMIPNSIEKIGKEHGVKVKRAQIDVDSSPRSLAHFMEWGKENGFNYDGARNDLANRWKNGDNDPVVQKFMEDKKPQNVHYIDIPESLKNQALNRGFPLFSSGFPGMMFIPVEGNPFKENKNDS